MNRRALLIAECPASDPIKGVYADLTSWRDFLHSCPGGVWNESEVVSAVNHGRGQLQAALQEMKEADYSLIVFAGHGHSVKGELPWAETHLHLANGETMTERELNPGTSSCTMVLDVCRMGPGIEEPLLMEKAASLESDFDPVKCRALYNQALEKAEKGLVSVYSTEVGSAAADISSFSQYLINSATKWARSNQGILTLQQAVSLATDAMAAKNPQQKPEYQGGRRLRHFPFAVHA